jgi:hypothetical protein
MGGFNALRAVGMLVRFCSEPGFLGSCFAFREARSVLTAAHCLEGVAKADVHVWLPDRGYARSVEAIRHPSADIAIVKLAPDDAKGIDPFRSTFGRGLPLGDDFLAYGYAVDVLGAEVARPTARLFKGHYQRFFEHTSHMGYAYVAGELSIPSPRGLSGGPLFSPRTHDFVAAMAAENIESTTTQEAVEHVLEGGERRSIHYQRVVSYGVAVMLSEVEDWLDDHLARFDAVAHAERQRQVAERKRVARQGSARTGS